MNEVLLLKLAHILGLTFWLGTDLAVFRTSFLVSDHRLPPPVRLSAAKLLLALDQAPRICMTLMLPLGLHLASMLGVLYLDEVALAIIWMLTAGWLAMVVILHIAAPSPLKNKLMAFDFWFRAVLATALLAWALGALLTDAVSMPDWVAWKIGIFGGLISCGLLIRVKLRRFGPAIANLAAGEDSDENNQSINDSIGATRPFVLLIWVGLIASAAIGLHIF